jgi:hypothetical protein
MASAVRSDLAEIPAFTGELIWRWVRNSNPRTVLGPPFTDLQSAAFDLFANAPKVKIEASGSGCSATWFRWPFAFFDILICNIIFDVGKQLGAQIGSITSFLW